MPPSEEARRILLVEDDVRLASLIREYLRQNGLSVSVEHRGDRAARRILTEQPDLVILDIMLPGRDGLAVCREVRTGFRGPILMLTARDEDVDQILGLELGADDYVTKPAEPRVLLARIRALFRRLRPGAPEHSDPPELAFDRLAIRRGSREVLHRGQAVTLSTGEFDLLWLLASRAGQVVGRDDILAALRGIEYDGIDRWVDVRISRLRRKLGDDGARPRRIKTVWGQGYLFVPDAWE